MQKMEQIKLAKLTLNIGVGEGGEKLSNAKTLLERVAPGKKAVITKARSRNPSFKVRKDDPIGVKLTLRGPVAADVLKRALESRDNIISQKSFDRAGNVSFGVREYIDFPGMKYDPKLGMMGFDVCVTLEKPGMRVARRKVRPAKVGRGQRVSPQQAIEFMQKNFGAQFAEAQSGTE